MHSYSVAFFQIGVITLSEEMNPISLETHINEQLQINFYEEGLYHIGNPVVKVTKRDTEEAKFDIKIEATLHFETFEAPEDLEFYVMDEIYLRLGEYSKFYKDVNSEVYES